MSADSLVKARIRAALPGNTFSRRPLRLVLMLPMVTAVVTISTLLVVLPMPWYVASVAAVVLGNIYGSLMFLAHEVGHGATVRSRRIQRLFMYPGCAIFLLSPRLWVIWHNQSHHGHTNRADEDPDVFGTLERFMRSRSSLQAVHKFAPGSRYWRSAVFFLTFFTIHSQTVLWSKSRIFPGYEGLDRRRAEADSIVMAAFWVALSVGVGLRAAIFVVVIPMLAANCVVLAYIVTNHMVRPLTHEADTLLTTMSVRTVWLLDRIHLNFSHHVEHHLFPAMPSSMTPRVREVLTTQFPNEYLAPTHWRALASVLRTPRLYDGSSTLFDPYHGFRVDIPQVESRLRGS
jgi:fatty acid desaturase